MKKHVLKSSLLSGLITLLLLAPWWSAMRCGSLTDVTKPYLGDYECQSAQYNGKDLLEDFSYIRLELEKGNNFTLHFQEKNGEPRTAKGKYQYNEKKGTVTMYAENFAGFKREFPLQKGMLIVELPIGGKNLFLKFKQK